MNVGDYVRTYDGYFFKVKELLEKGKYNDSENKIVQRFRIDGLYQKNNDYLETDYIYSDWIIKSSPNIIDLIKKKDILIDYEGNIYQVVKVWNNYVFTDKKNEYGQIITLVDYQIKSIVTHEQFESMKYKVDE